MSLTAIAFLLAYAAGNVLALARHPIYGLITYVGVYYLNPHYKWWGAAVPSLRYALWAAVVTLIALVIHRERMKRQRAFLSFAPAKVMAGLVAWMALQLTWVAEVDAQLDLLEQYAKFAIVLYLMHRIIASRWELKLFLWAHVAGCVYMSWVAYGSYLGGRFEGFGGGDLSEANAGALQLVTGIYVASALFLAAQWRERVGLAGAMPFLLNAVVTTISRGGFLAGVVGGVMFNVFAPKGRRTMVRALSALAIVVFGSLTTATYWQRINTIQHLGEEVEGLDTGGGRLLIIAAQIEMFKANPFGHGHLGTAFLSPYYLRDEHLTGVGEDRARSSHNTFMSFLVEHGVVGAAAYVVLLVWAVRILFRLRREVEGRWAWGELILPGVAAALAAVFVADLFVSYVKLEVRFWLLGAAMAMVRLWEAERVVEQVSRGAEVGEQSMGELGGQIVGSGHRSGTPVIQR